MGITQWLYRAYNLNAEIEQLRDDYRKEFDRATNMVANLSGDSVTSTKDPHKNENLAYIKEQIDRMISMRMRILSDVLECIETVKDTNERRILNYRFISSYSWQTISEKMSYSERQTFRIYKKALRSVRPAVESKMSLNVS